MQTRLDNNEAIILQIAMERRSALKGFWILWTKCIHRWRLALLPHKKPHSRVSSNINIEYPGSKWWTLRKRVHVRILFILILANLWIVSYTWHGWNCAMAIWPTHFTWHKRPGKESQKLCLFQESQNCPCQNFQRNRYINRIKIWSKSQLLQSLSLR